VNVGGARECPHPGPPPLRRGGSVAAIAGVSVGVLQLAGALKTAPPLAGLPFDLSIVAFAIAVPMLAVLAATRRWEVDSRLGPPLAAAALLMAWLVVAGSWTASREVAAQRLPEIVLAGPAMVAAGLIAGAEPAARRALVLATLLIGVVIAATVGWGVTAGWGVRAVLDPGAARLQYQIAGLAIATAAAIAAVRAAEARSVGRALPWLILVAALAAAALLPGGRTALAALGLGVALAPALRLWLGGRRRRAAGWLAGTALAGAGCTLMFLLRPEEVAGLRTLERLTTEAGGLNSRLGLWAAALRWAGEAAPLGLGTGGFTIAAGHGERRGLYVHNHALEALAEGGLPGLLLWVLAFGGAIVAAARMMREVAPGRAARVAAMVLPVVLTVLVSTDLGNRMAWFALGLALSLCVRSARHV